MTEKTKTRAKRRWASRVVGALFTASAVLGILQRIVNLPETLGDLATWYKSVPMMKEWASIIVPLVVGVGLIVWSYWDSIKRKWLGVSEEEDEDVTPDRDLAGWDALQYILKKTSFGRGKQSHEVVAALRQAAVDGRITVWASRPRKPHMIIPKDKFGEYTLTFEPGGSGGMIQKDGGWLTGGDVYYEPMFSRQEIEREFGKR